MPKNHTTEEHQNNEQVDKAVKIEVAQVDLDWQCKGELSVAEQARKTSGHLGRDATYRWESSGPDHGDHHADHPQM